MSHQSETTDIPSQLCLMKMNNPMLYSIWVIWITMWNLTIYWHLRIVTKICTNSIYNCEKIDLSLFLNYLHFILRFLITHLSTHTLHKHWYMFNKKTQSESADFQISFRFLVSAAAHTAPQIFKSLTENDTRQSHTCKKGLNMCQCS